MLRRQNGVHSEIRNLTRKTIPFSSCFLGVPITSNFLKLFLYEKTLTIQYSSQQFTSSNISLSKHMTCFLSSRDTSRSYDDCFAHEKNLESHQQSSFPRNFLATDNLILFLQNNTKSIEITHQCGRHRK